MARRSFENMFHHLEGVRKCDKCGDNFDEINFPQRDEHSSVYRKTQTGEVISSMWLEEGVKGKEARCVVTLG